MGASDILDVLNHSEHELFEIKKRLEGLLNQVKNEKYTVLMLKRPNKDGKIFTPSDVNNASDELFGKYKENYFPKGVDSPHPMIDPNAVLLFSIRAIVGDSFTPFIMDGDKLVTGVHRSCANDLLEYLGYGRPIKFIDLNLIDSIDEDDARDFRKRLADDDDPNHAVIQREIVDYMDGLALDELKHVQLTLKEFAELVQGVGNYSPRRKEMMERAESFIESLINEREEDLKG